MKMRIDKETDDGKEEGANHKHTLFLLILRATCDPRKDLRSHASELLMKLCSRNGGVDSLVMLFANLDKIEIIQMLEFWTKIELQRIQRKRGAGSEINLKEGPRSNGEHDQKEGKGRELESTMCERRLNKKETTVEILLLKTAAMDNIAWTARAERQQEILREKMAY